MGRLPIICSGLWTLFGLRKGGLNLGPLLSKRIAVVVLIAGAPLGWASAAQAQQATAKDPIILVHGYVGSEAQSEFQKLRCVENGRASNPGLAVIRSGPWPGHSSPAVQGSSAGG